MDAVSFAKARSALLLPKVPLFEHIGHSYAQGTGAWSDEYGYGKRLGRLLGAERIINRGYAGAVACHATNNGIGDGGWAWLLNSLGPTATLSQVTPWVSPGKFGSRHCVVSYEHALNDIGWVGTATQPIIEAHRAVLSRLCATRLYMQNSAGSFTGTWATSGSSSIAAGNGWNASSTPASQWSITVDADAPPGVTFAFGAIVLPTDNVVATITKNGTPVATINGVSTGATGQWTINGANACDPNYTATNKQNVTVARIGAVSAGDVIVISLTTVTAGSLKMNFAHLEANPLDGPLIVIPLPSHLPAAGYTFYASNGFFYAVHTGLSDGVIDTGKTALKALAAEFSNVLTVDFDALGIIDTTAWSGGTYIADGVHPNNDSHAQRAEAIFKAIVQSGKLTSRLCSRYNGMSQPMFFSLGGSAAWGVSSLLGIALANSWAQYDSTNSTFTDTYPGYYRDEAGRVHFRGRLKSGASGTSIGTLPAGYGTKVVRNYIVPAGTDDVWTLTVSDTSGNGTLTINGQTTGNIPFNASSSAVATAINALSGVSNGGTGSVVCSGSLSTGMTITFTGGQLAGASQSVTLNAGTLAGGTHSVTHTTTGSIGTATAQVRGAGNSTTSIVMYYTGSVSWVDLSPISYVADNER